MTRRAHGRAAHRVLSRPRTLGLVLLVAVAASPACYHYRSIAVQPADSTHVGGSRGPATDPESEVVWSKWWGLAQEQPTIDNCNEQDLHSVTVSSNFGYTLFTILTLGAFSPARVEWTCAKPRGSGVIGADGEGGVIGEDEEEGVIGEDEEECRCEDEDADEDEGTETGSPRHDTPTEEGTE